MHTGYLFYILFLLLPLISLSCLKEVNRPFDSDIRDKLNYIPESVNYISYFNIQKLKSSKYFRFLYSAQSDNVKDLILILKNNFKLNLRNDVSEIIYAYDINNDFKYFVIKGDFIQHNETIDSIKSLYFFYPDSQTLFLSNDSTIIKRIKYFENIESLTNGKIYSFLSSTVRFKSSFWAASVGGEIAREIIGSKGLNGENLEKIISSINFISLSFEARSELKFSSTWLCKDYFTASLVKSIFDWMIPTAKLTNPQDSFNEEFSKMNFKINVDKLEINYLMNEKSIERINKSYLNKKFKINIEN